VYGQSVEDTDGGRRRSRREFHVSNKHRPRYGVGSWQLAVGTYGRMLADPLANG
jgi:hypothetical protein